MLLYIHKGEGALSKISPKCPSSVLLTDWSLLRKRKIPPYFYGVVCVMRRHVSACVVSMSKEVDFFFVGDVYATCKYLLYMT